MTPTEADIERVRAAYEEFNARFEQIKTGDHPPELQAAYQIFSRPSKAKIASGSPPHSYTRRPRGCSSAG